MICKSVDGKYFPSRADLAIVIIVFEVQLWYNFKADENVRSGDYFTNVLGAYNWHLAKVIIFYFFIIIIQLAHDFAQVKIAELQWPA